MPHDHHDRIHRGDRTLITLLGQQFSYNEVHSCALGAALGFFYAVSPFARRTIVREPHYAVASALGGYLIARAIHSE